MSKARINLSLHSVDLDALSHNEIYVTLDRKVSIEITDQNGTKLSLWFECPQDLRDVADWMLDAATHADRTPRSGENHFIYVDRSCVR